MAVIRYVGVNMAKVYLSVNMYSRIYDSMSPLLLRMRGLCRDIDRRQSTLGGWFGDATVLLISDFECDRFSLKE